MALHISLTNHLFSNPVIRDMVDSWVGIGAAMYGHSHIALRISDTIGLIKAGQLEVDPFRGTQDVLNAVEAIDQESLRMEAIGDLPDPALTAEVLAEVSSLHEHFVKQQVSIHAARREGLLVSNRA